MSVEVKLVPGMRSKPNIVISFDQWTDVIEYDSRRDWITGYMLFFIYQYGKIEGIRLGTNTKFAVSKGKLTEARNLYPPVIIFSYPRDKLGILNALKYLKAKHKQRVDNMFSEAVKKENFEEFERFIVSLGISEKMGGR